MIFPAPYTALQLRCLIRNGEAQIAHLADQLETKLSLQDIAAAPGHVMAEREAMLQRLGDAIRSLRARQNALTALTPLPPAATILAGRTYTVQSQSAASPSIHV